MCKRHAYLIMAHSDPEHLSKLVEAIDDYRNDIFIHLDKKSDISKFLHIKAKKSKLKFIEERIDVRWGDPSQIDAEYALLRYGAICDYGRIHLISGADFPLKSQDEIHAFFEKYPEKEFISFENEKELVGELRKKMRLYNFFLPYISNPNLFVASFFNFARRTFLLLQMILRINRSFSINELKKGSNWASITLSFVNKLLEYEKEIKQEYCYTHCCDEIYKQTIAWNCGFKNRISPKGNMRLIDFKRGNRCSPYTFTESDYNILKSADALFARKFSSSVSGHLTEQLKDFWESGINGGA